MRNMTSRLIAATVFVASLMVPSSATGDDVKLFRVKPAGAVYGFLESIEIGDKSYVGYIDFDLFFESNKKSLTKCDVAQIKKYMDEFVMLPLRHDPALTGKFVERNEYQITEEIIDYRAADVTFVKVSGGKKTQEIRFKLVARLDQWVITNMSGYFEKYIFQACSGSTSPHLE